VCYRHTTFECFPFFLFLIVIRAYVRKEFETITEGLADALDFTRTIGFDSGRGSVGYERGGGRGVLGEVDFYTRSAIHAYRRVSALLQSLSHQQS
jgi:hypothetical protein